MVILFLCKFLKTNGVINNVYALHLEYINREESKNETKLISDYCSVLKIPLYVRTIDYMSRTSVERNFYEDETKKVRFRIFGSSIQPAPLWLKLLHAELLSAEWNTFNIK